MVGIAAGAGLLLLGPMTVPAVTTQAAIPITTVAQVSCDYDAGSVRNGSDNVLIGSDASQQPVPFFGQFAKIVAAKNAGGAADAFQGAILTEHLTQLEKYGAGGFKQLESGRVRYYGELTKARNPGEMAGARVVREWDPASGAKRTWIEAVDQQGSVRIVRPETGGEKVHYVFDAEGNYVGTR
jgi:hypothetical protein